MGSEPAVTMDAVRVRDLRPEDVAPLAALVEATGAFQPAEVEVARELLDAGADRGEASGYLFRVAMTEGELAGYACFGPTPCTEGTFDLYWIAVNPRRQGQGIATRLLSEAEDALRRRGGRLLVAETEDAPPYAAARAFYEGAGFRREASIPDFYRPGNAKIIYVKTITTAQGGQ